MSSTGGNNNDRIDNTTHQIKTESTTNNERANEGALGTVTGAGSSLAELGSNASAMAGESMNEIKNRVSAISPSGVVDSVRGQFQLIARGGDNGESEETLENGDSLDQEEHERIDNMEREKITEFLQEKHKSTADLRAGK